MRYTERRVRRYRAWKAKRWMVERMLKRKVLDEEMEAFMSKAAASDGLVEDEVPPLPSPENMDEEDDFEAEVPKKMDTKMADDDDDDDDGDFDPVPETKAESSTAILWNEGLSEEDDDSDFAPSSTDDELWCDAAEKEVLKQLDLRPPPFVQCEPLESYRYPSKSQTFVGEMALLVDDEGRCKLAGGVKPDLSFKTEVWENAVQVTDALRTDAINVFERCIQKRNQGDAYSSGSTFWVPANADRSRLCGLERLALDIFDRHVASHYSLLNTHPNAQSSLLEQSGAEWWTLAMDPDQGQVGWHWDRDYSLEDKGSVNMPPHLSTVTYLTDDGAPTIVTELWPPRAGQQPFAKLGNACAVVEPRVGKHLKFDGRFLHAAIDIHETLHSDALASKSTSSEDAASSSSAKTRPKRITFLVNVWLEWHPTDAEPLPHDVKRHLILQPPENTPLEKKLGSKKHRRHKVKVNFLAAPSSNNHMLFRHDQHNQQSLDQQPNGLTDIIIQPQDLKVIQPVAWNFEIPNHRARVALALNKEWFHRIPPSKKTSSSFLFRLDTSKAALRPLCAVATTTSTGEDDRSLAPSKASSPRENGHLPTKNKRKK